MNERCYHDPVMVSEVMEFLAPGPGHVIVDGTLGGGGHAEAILSWSGPGDKKIGLLIGIDRDPESLAAAGLRLSPHLDRVKLVKGGFESIPLVLEREGIEGVDGVLLDLGVSMHQLREGARGFSFQKDAPLDMRMDQDDGESAAELLMRLSERELADIIRDYGEERYSRRIAGAVEKRKQEGMPVRTTLELAALIERAVPKAGRDRIHPATRTFQALRIAVNRELERLAEAVERLPDALVAGGRAVIISYHSLEDRIVKKGFADFSKSCHCPPAQPVCTCGGRATMRLLTRRPVRPGDDEIKRNPASRSARLRAALRLGV